MSDLKERLDSIHKKIFSKFTYKTDEAKYGELEHWAMPDESTIGVKVVGDCEDFALACRALCRKENIPSRLVYCKVETGEGHCVLEVEGWILDNRYRKVRPRQELDYTWIRISGYEPGDDWHVIEQ